MNPNVKGMEGNGKNEMINDFGVILMYFNVVFCNTTIIPTVDVIILL